MTVTMDNAAKTLREIMALVLVERNIKNALCLSEQDTDSAIAMVAENRKFQMMVALGGMGTKLADELEQWLHDYEQTRWAWLTKCAPGRIVLKERAPEVYARLLRDEREHKARVKQASRIRKTAYV